MAITEERVAIWSVVYVGASAALPASVPAKVFVPAARSCAPDAALDAPALALAAPDGKCVEATTEVSRALPCRSGSRCDLVRARAELGDGIGKFRRRARQGRGAVGHGGGARR